MIREPLKTLLEAAILAPSGDNTQPWRFEVDEQNSRITVCVDETRDTSPMNAGQRMARIACGAAIENMVQTADHNGWAAHVELHDTPLQSATLKLQYDDYSNASIPAPIQQRHTNRQFYDGQPLTDEEKTQLVSAVPDADDISLCWITESTELNQWSHTIGSADAKMFGHQRFLRAFLDKVRFDLPTHETAAEGLSTRSLELSPPEQWLLPKLWHAPQFLLRSWMFQTSFRKKAEKLVRSASGLVLLNPSITTSGNTLDVQVGRMMQRVWLALTAAGYQAQPMMSLPVLNCAHDFGLEKLPASLLRKTMPLAILRFGKAAAAIRCVGRLPLAEVTSQPTLSN